MKKLILLLTLILFSYGADSDLDGVADSLDKCPNTPFLETVDANGCSKQQLSTHKLKYNISIGYEKDYDNSNSYNIYFTSISTTYKKYYFNYFYSLMDSNSNDSILSIYYKKTINNIHYKGGVKLYFTTANNDKLDYAFKLKGSYYFKKYTLSISEKHKIYGESNTNAKDTLTAELGFIKNKWYLSPYAYVENSEYDSSDWNYYAGIFAQYGINKKLSLNGDYSHNLSDDISSLVISLSYIY